jgi:hypothetical protein
LIFLIYYIYSLLFRKTREIENNQFENDSLPIYIYYTPLPIEGLELDHDETNRTYIFVTSIDSNQSIAKQTFDYGNLLFYTG